MTHIVLLFLVRYDHNISVYFDDFFNDYDNYISYSISEILVNELMSFKDLCNTFRSKLGSYIDIYLCLGSIECLKKDLLITNDNGVKWIYHIITSNMKQNTLQEN